MFNFRILSILATALVAGVVISVLTWPPPPARVENKIENNIENKERLKVPPVDDTPGIEFSLPHPSAVKYVAPKDRADELRHLDRAVLFLTDSQEDDGHWSSSRTGASGAYRNLNGDIGLTAIASYVLMSSSTKESPNQKAVAAGGKAIKWLQSKLNADGTLGELNGPGEQALSQLLGGAAFMQAAGMSTREMLRRDGQKIISVALLRMMAQNGGYGPDANSAEPRMDVMTWASCICKFASNEGMFFEVPQFGGADLPEPKDDKARDARYKAHRANEETIITNLRKGLKRLEAKGSTAPEGKSSGVFAAAPGGEANWDATVGGMLANFLINPQRSTVAPSLEFVFGEFDPKTESYPRIFSTMKLPEGNEGYHSDTAWFGSFAVSYLFTDDKYQHKSWVGNLKPMLRTQQQSDGGWPLVGPDAKRGRVWRTALHGLTLMQLAPPPPPPAPPTDAFSTPAVPNATNPK